jgi:hypothetical protein
MKSRKQMIGKRRAVASLVIFTARDRDTVWPQVRGAPAAKMPDAKTAYQRRDTVRVPNPETLGPVGLPEPGALVFALVVVALGGVSGTCLQI